MQGAEYGRSSMTSLDLVKVAGRARPIENQGVTLIEAPTLEALANTIRHEHERVVSAGQKMLRHAIICGDALREAKARAGRGNWIKWADENVPFGSGTVAFYIRAAAHADLLSDNGIDTVTGARRFLTEQSLVMASDDRQLDEGEIAQLRTLDERGTPKAQIARIIGCSRKTVANYLADHEHGKRRGRAARYRRKSGRKATGTKPFAITDDLVEGAAVKLRELFAPSANPAVTDADRDAAVEVLRAAFTYDGPIPGG